MKMLQRKLELEMTDNDEEQMQNVYNMIKPAGEQYKQTCTFCVLMPGLSPSFG